MRNYYRNYNKGRKVDRGSGVGTVVTAILVVFLVVSLVPVLLSFGRPNDDWLPTEPKVTEPTDSPSEPSEPTEPEVPTDPTDPPEPATESGYLLYQLDSSGQKLYLNIEDNDTGASLVSDPSAACLYRWDSRWETFVSSSANRFFVYDDEDDYFNTLVIDSENVGMTLQFWETDDTIMSDSDCPLEGNQHPYYLAVMLDNGRSICYDGLVFGGRLEGMDSSALAVQVYVEYVTREVVSNE